MPVWWEKSLYSVVHRNKAGTFSTIVSLVRLQRLALKHYLNIKLHIDACFTIKMFDFAYRLFMITLKCRQYEINTGILRYSNKALHTLQVEPRPQCKLMDALGCIHIQPCILILCLRRQKAEGSV